MLDDSFHAPVFKDPELMVSGEHLNKIVGSTCFMLKACLTRTTHLTTWQRLQDM